MNIRELLKRDHGIDVRISSGTGHRNDPYVVDRCSAEESALTQLHLLRGIALGLGELWRIKEWKSCDIGSATEIIRVEAVRFTSTQIETEMRAFYFDTRAVSNDPFSLHPMISWQEPSGSLTLPYELGWLHFDEALNNAPYAGTFDQTILYSGSGAKLSIYVYDRSASVEGVGRDEELKSAAAILLNPDLEDPWPVIEMGPLAMKFFLSGSDITAVGVAVSGLYFVKVRLTYFDEPKMRELMNSTMMVLVAYLQYATTARH